jgi:hypothetical protein|tara:strand:- start:1031 stop:1153 length:123 start_codon:yes stop_codon:yes gene_type:complete
MATHTSANFPEVEEEDDSDDDEEKRRTRRELEKYFRVTAR